MIDLKVHAMGRPCQLRAPGVCSHDPETTVGAHIRRGGSCGIGMKPSDLCIVWACNKCHDLIDGRTKLPEHITRGMLDGWILDAMCRTNTILDREGEVLALDPEGLVS